MASQAHGVGLHVLRQGRLTRYQQVTEPRPHRTLYGLLRLRVRALPPVLVALHQMLVMIIATVMQRANSLVCRSSFDHCEQSSHLNQSDKAYKDVGTLTLLTTHGLTVHWFQPSRTKLHYPMAPRCRPHLRLEPQQE